MKKIVLMASTAILCFGMISQAWADVVASGNDCGTNCSWSIEDGILSIFVTEGATSGSMKSFSDTSNHAPWYDYRSSISSISVEGKKTDTNGDKIENSGITSVGSYAFYNVPAKSVDIPNSVKSLGSYAFRWSSVESFEVPDSVTSFGTGVFRDAL